MSVATVLVAMPRGIADDHRERRAIVHRRRVGKSVGIGGDADHGRASAKPLVEERRRAIDPDAKVRRRTLQHSEVGGLVGDDGRAGGGWSRVGPKAAAHEHGREPEDFCVGVLHKFDSVSVEVQPQAEVWPGITEEDESDAARTNG